MSDISGLAQSILDYEFDGDASVAPLTSISGWVSSHVGELNTLIHTSFEVSGNHVTPTGSFCAEEESIMRAMYLKSFNNSMSRKTLQGATTSSDFIQIRDADGSMIVRPNKTTAAGVYRSLSSSYADELGKLVNSYISFQTKPVQVAGKDAPSG
jgi:hypothetical protein